MAIDRSVACHTTDRDGAGSVRFTRRAAEKHIQRHHPGCPADVRAVLIAALADKAWVGCSLGKAFGIAATNYVRHRMTDYERLLKLRGMTRDEARLIVAGEVQDIMRSWRA